MAKGALDPKDWDSFKQEAHRMLEASLDKMQAAEEGRVWTPMPEAMKSDLKTAVPQQGRSPADVRAALEQMLPYGVGNTHPRFWGWVHGTGTAGGILAEMASAAVNANLGGRDHGGIYVEKAVLDWCKEMMGFPAEASGLLVSGTSMATIIAVKTARDKRLGIATRQRGTGATKLVGYCSAQAHSCVGRAFDMVGLGTDAVRKIPVDDDFRMDMAALAQAIATDRANGFEPFFVAGTAGAVNVGSIDDLAAIADLSAAQDLWFHVDGAFGASACLSAAQAPLLEGMARADSLAFDFHKWLHVSYDAGCILIRDADAHLAAFSERPDYLAPATRGLAAGDFWPVDYGPELSRGYRALKVWAHLQEHGTEALGAAIARNCAQAQMLAGLVDDAATLERLAPVVLNIVCFRYLPAMGADADGLNAEIAVRLQESGVAVVSTTLLHGKLALRVNITNHRTRDSDLSLLVDAVLQTGRQIDGEAS